MLKKPLVLSLLLWSLLFLPLLLARKTVELGEKIADLSDEKIKSEGNYSVLLKEENILKYALIRGEVNATLQKSAALASLPDRRNPSYHFHFVHKDTMELAIR